MVFQMNSFSKTICITIITIILINNYVFNIDTYSVEHVDNSVKFVKTFVLRNSYILQYRKLVESSNDFRFSVVRDYFVLNIDNDNYPDLLIWYFGKIDIWSYRYGVYASYRTITSPVFYITKPIPIDSNNDGVVDYILVFESSYIDGTIQLPPYTNIFTTYITKWVPLTGERRVLSRIYNYYVDTTTYYIHNGFIYIPMVNNTYVDISFNKTRTYCSRIGLVRIDLTTLSVSTFIVKTYCSNTPESSVPGINDYTTNYEIYLVGSGAFMYLIPSGLDRVIRVKIVSRNIVLDREYSFGQSDWNDNLMVLGRDYPAVSFGGHGGRYVLWRSPQRLDIKISGEYLIIPTAEFLWLSPVGSERNVFFRVERIRGVLILNTVNGVWREVNLRKTGSRIITSIVIDTSSNTILYGGVIVNSYDTIREPFVNAYNYLTDRDWNIWYRGVPQYADTYTFHTVVNIWNSRRIYATLYALRVDGDERDAVFHATQRYTSYFYTNYPPSIIKPVIIDIDGDGIEEYLFIMQYADYTGTNRYDPGIYGLYPQAFGRATYIVWFRKPYLMSLIECVYETCHVVNFNQYFGSTRYSSVLIEIRDPSERVIYSRNISANNWFRETISFKNPGRYGLDASTLTIYYVYDKIEWGLIDVKISYSERIVDLITLDVKYRTRIEVVKPSIKTLTPNHYENGFETDFILEYQDFNDGKWYRLSGYSNDLVVKLINSTRNLVKTPRDLGNGFYRAFFNNITPSTYTLLIEFAGSPIHLPSSAIISKLEFIKYPVEISITLDSEIPALTPLLINISYLKYRFIDSDGNWFEEDLTIGDNIELTISIYGTDIIVFRNKYPVTTRYMIIPSKYILPGNYSILVKYNSNNIYYSEAFVRKQYSVNKLRLWIDIIDLLDNTSIAIDPIVVYCSKLLVEMREYVSESMFRPVSVEMMIVIFNDIDLYSFRTNNSVFTIHTSEIKPGNYTVDVFPVEYSMVYNPPWYRFNLCIIEARGFITGFLEPLIRVNTSSVFNETSYSKTYALIPVKLYLNVSTYPEELLKESVIKVIIDDRVYVVNDISKPFVFTPVKPGFREVKLVLETKYFRVINTTYLTVYPHPVKIIVGKGSIIVKTIDLLNRSAPGLLFVEIYDMYKNLVFKNSYKSNGSLIIDDFIGNGWFYIYIEYRGNESYSNTNILKYIYIDHNYPNIKVVEEPYGLSFIIISIIISYLLLRKTRSGRIDESE